MKKTILAAFFIVFSNHINNAQTSFLDGSEMLSDTAFFSFLTKGICDVDGDQLDDIIRISRLGHAYILYQQADGHFIADSIGQVSSQTQITTSIGDLDNNGYKDIFTGGAGDGMKIIYSFENHHYEIDTLEGTPFLVQGSNISDINGDGLLDLFACNDDGLSNIWLQNEDQTFTANNDYINMVTTPDSDNSGNYGSVWTDIDNDGDVDLYISKCKAGVDASTDPRRINTLFINDNGNYTEEAFERGVASGEQSWAADFGDIDNDGDMDLFIANHGSPSQLLLNDGQGYFSDISEMSQVYDDGKAYQCLFNDYDNDGYLDLLISGFECFLWKNNGDHTFSRVDCPDPNNGGEPMRSFATGDLNNDGFTDIYASYWLGQLSPPIPYDKLWLNEGNSNNYCSILLSQADLNRDVIGARITLFSQGIQQVREVRSGESYGISNSFTKTFGLATANVVDSVWVQWPGSYIEVFEDIQTNALNVLEKGTGTLLSTDTNNTIANNKPILIYPNPTINGTINMVLPADLRNVGIEIYTMNGIKLYAKDFPNTSSTTSINIGHHIPLVKSTSLIVKVLSEGEQIGIQIIQYQEH